MLIMNHYDFMTNVQGFMMQNKTLSPLAKLVYARLGAHCDEETGQTQQTFTRIEQECGSSAKKVYSAFQELTHQGLLLVHRCSKRDFACSFLRHESMFMDVDELEDLDDLGELDEVVAA